MTILELNTFIEKHGFAYNDKRKSQVERAMRLRVKLLNEKFEYSADQIEQIRSVNKRIWDVMQTLYDNMAEINYHNKLLAERGFVQYKHYFITGFINIYTEKDTLRNKLFIFSDKLYWNITYYETQEKLKALELYKNWNQDVFSHPAFSNIYICHATYIIFSELGLYSLDDMCFINIKEDDIECIDDIAIRGIIQITMNDIAVN